jgi:hypothetical protein
MSTARTTAIVEAGHNVWATAGAAGGPKRKIMQCNECRDLVVWVEGKTGRFYLAQVLYGLGEFRARYYRADKAHRCSERQAEIAQRRIDEERKAQIRILHDRLDNTDDPIVMRDIADEIKALVASWVD